MLPITSVLKLNKLIHCIKHITRYCFLVVVTLRKAILVCLRMLLKYFLFAVLSSSIHFILCQNDTIPIFSECGGEINVARGVITSPNYPQNYNDNSRCTWTISDNEGSQVQVSINFKKLC